MICRGAMRSMVWIARRARRRRSRRCNRAAQQQRNGEEIRHARTTPSNVIKASTVFGICKGATTLCALETVSVARRRDAVMARLGLGEGAGGARAEG